MPYIITKKTYALIPVGTKTRVIEDSKVYLVNEEISTLVARNCFHYGSSLMGRQKGSSYLLKTTYKPPIIMNEKELLILIPTHSIRNKKCCWITLNSILSYYPAPYNLVFLEFKNNNKMKLPISYSIFDRQVLKATRLESILRGRNNQKYL